MTTLLASRFAFGLGQAWKQIATDLRERRKRLTVAFFRLMDKQIPTEWLLFAIGVVALALFLFTLWLTPHYR